MLALAASSSGAKAQVLPNPDSLIPFAPVTCNGPVAGVDGLFMFGSFNAGAGSGVTFWTYDGNTGMRVAYPSTFSPPVPVPFTVGPANLPDLAPLLLHNGLGAGAGVDPAEDDNPQGLAGAMGGPGGRTMHQRRHHLVPANQDLVPWIVDDGIAPRLVVSTVVKIGAIDAGQTEGGVLSVDYMGANATSVPPVASSVWPSQASANLAGGAGANAVPYVPIPTPGQPQVLSDLAPNVYGSPNPRAPNSLAWATGTQTIGDTPPPPPAPLAPGLLVVADHTLAGAAPLVATTLLQSPFSPCADKLLVWNDIGGYLPGAIPQYVLVPCRDGVEVYDPGLVGQGGELLKVVPAAPGKEICSNVSFFGPSPYDDTPPTAYFIVLERDRGESQAAGGGVNFIVFDLLSGSIPARGLVGTNGTMPGLVDTYGREPLDAVRGFNDIAVAPPERDATGEWNPTPAYGPTAWFGVWDANTALQATPASPAPLFGGLVGVENHGLASYSDGGFGLNAAGPFPPGTNVRYFSPARNATGALFTATVPESQEISYPVPVGEASTNPIFNPLPGQGLVNQNLVAWYWDNGSQAPDEGQQLGTGYGVAILDVAATWTTANPAYPGGLTVDGSGGGAYFNYIERSQETITERPLFGYINYPVASILFAQRQCGIETFAAMLAPGTPRGVYAVTRLAPQTAAPSNPVAWTYQKRRHTAWNPPPGIHPDVNPPQGNPEFPYTFGLDTAGAIQATEQWDEINNPQPRGDDWISYFVNWRWSVQFGTFLPFSQNAVYWDWASPRAGQNLLPLGLNDATTAPPPTQRDFAAGPIQGFPFYSFGGQTPLWADWTGGGSALYPGFEFRPVLRSHTNPFPIMGPADNNAWVGIGAQQMLKYSFGFNLLASSAGPWPPGPLYPLGAPGRRSIILMHIDQTGANAGLSPAFGGGPGRFRVNFLHIQSNPAAGAGPGFEATYVNNPLGTDWQDLLPAGEVVSTEILALDLPSL